MTAPTHQSATLPQNIAFDKWADIGFTWQGDVPVTALPRLAGQVIASDDVLSVALTLARQDKILWLTYDVKAVLSVACQRCLDSMPVDVSGNYRMAILESENKIGYLEALDETADYVLLDEICPNGKKNTPCGGHARR